MSCHCRHQQIWHLCLVDTTLLSLCREICFLACHLHKKHSIQFTIKHQQLNETRSYVHRLKKKSDGGRKGDLFCCYFQFYIMPNTEFTQLSIILMHLCFRTPKSPTVLSACHFQQKHLHVQM